MKQPARLLSAVCALALTASSLAHADDSPPSVPAIFTHGERVLFQGDSITDMNRGRSDDPNHILGHSYAFLIGAKFGSSYPELGLVFINRGVSGNTITDLAKRWKSDTLDQKPDVLSVLIGINDISKAINANQKPSVDAFIKTYDQLLTDARTQNPKLKIILCEPFVFPGKNTTARLADWQQATREFDAAVEALAKKYHAPAVRLQPMFDAAAKKDVPDTYWIWDGIHPTYSGQQLLMDEWVRTYASGYGPNGK